MIRDRHDNPDGSFFEIQENAMSDTQFIVYGKSLKFGGDLEMYSKKTTIDSYADTAINVMLITSILALCATLVAIYFYSKKFTKPLIEMSSVTGGMADMAKGMKINKSLIDMGKGFTVKRVCMMAGGLFTKEQILEINAKLNKIKKKQK